MHQLQVTIPDELALVQFGRRLAALLPVPAVIALNGTLGAGKTRLVQALGEALNIPAETILSPTYTLIHEYAVASHTALKTVYHLDMYRLRDVDEYWELGVDEFLDEPAWIIIEWADRIQIALPRDYLQIDISVVSASSRQLTLTAHGTVYQELLTQLAMN
jgi:tRNA threonylcarbamoyladenosine biosynthesis protein TsaE